MREFSPGSQEPFAGTWQILALKSTFLLNHLDFGGNVTLFPLHLGVRQTETLSSLSMNYCKTDMHPELLCRRSSCVVRREITSVMFFYKSNTSVRGFWGDAWPQRTQHCTVAKRHQVDGTDRSLHTSWSKVSKKGERHGPRALHVSEPSSGERWPEGEGEHKFRCCLRTWAGSNVRASIPCLWHISCWQMNSKALPDWTHIGIHNAHTQQFDAGTELLCTTFPGFWRRFCWAVSLLSRPNIEMVWIRNRWG